MEELGDLLGKRGAARDREAQTPAEGLVQLAEHERVGDAVLEAEHGRDRTARLLELRHLPTHPDRPVEDLALDRRARLRLGEDARIDLLEHAGHAADEVRLHLGQVLAELVDALGERGGEAPVHADERLEPREGVRERQEEQVGVAVLDPRHLGRGPERAQVVAVGLDHALGRAGGARRVHDGGDVFRPDRGHPARQLPAEPLEVVPSEAPQPIPGHDPGRGLALVALHHHDLLEPFHLALHLEDLGELRRILDEQGLHPRVVDDVLDEVRGVARIDRNGATARGEGREVGLHPFGATRGQDADRLVLAAAEGEQAGGQLAHDLPDLAPGTGAPRAALLPLLGRPVAVGFDPMPEHARQRHVGHGSLLTPVCGALCAGSCRSGSWAANPRSGSPSGI